MNISVKTKNYQLTDAMRELIEGKFSALAKFEKGTEGTTALECEIEQSIAAVRAGARYRAEGNLTINGKLFRAEAMDNTLEGAVDSVRDDLTRELGRARGRARGLLKRGGAAFKRWLRFGR